MTEEREVKLEERAFSSLHTRCGDDGDGKKCESSVSFLGLPVQTAISWVA